MHTHRTVIYLRDGIAWVAEIEGGRARISPLTAWLSAHPGRGAVRSLALGPNPAGRPVAPRVLRAGALAATLLGRLLGRRIPAEARPGSGLAAR
jgi:hypothetical protein